MTYQVSQEVMRIAIMGERYGSGDMRIVCRAFRELYAIHQSSQVIPPPVEEAQPGPPSPSAPAAYWPCWPVEEAFDANEANSKWDRYAI